MRNLRRVSLDAAAMFDFPLAADARMSQTDYLDDQVWSLKLGAGDAAALTLQTAYGGRASLVSLTPILHVDNQQIFQARQFARPPIVTHFAPNFMRVEAEIRSGLDLTARFWVMESRAAGGDFTLQNSRDHALDIQLDLFCHVTREGRKRKINVLTLADYRLALHLGQIGNLKPAVTLENASIEVYGGRISSPKLGCKLRLAPGEKQRIRFATAGLENMRASLSLADNWMARPWQPFFDKIDALAAAAPRFCTGDESQDLLLDLSVNLFLKSLMTATDKMPHDSFVAFRAPNRGLSPRGTGLDHIRGWDGQDPTLAWLLVPTLASIAPEAAKGIVLNYLATMRENGFVDRQPGLSGQGQNLLMAPVLARMAWTIHEVRDEREFIAEVYPELMKFFAHWLTRDVDGDGAPEWQAERQLGYLAFPTFGAGRGWSQSADLSLMETPDLLAFLISEADALLSMANALGESSAATKLGEQKANLLRALESLWTGDRYAYRDRDTHEMGASLELLRHGAGDQTHHLSLDLPKPQRLIIRVVGGASYKPPLQLTLKGVDASGAPLEIIADADGFDWHQREGIYTTPPLSFVNTISFSGLSRVYKISAATPDFSRLDINHLLPMYTGSLPVERAAALVKLATEKAHFACRNGITMVSRGDRNFDPSNARGGGGVWMHWLSLIGEGMVKSGYHAEATALLQRVLSGLSDILWRDRRLSQFYHSDEMQGFGEAHHIAGAAPLHLMSLVIGIRIPSPSRVQVGGDFTWGKPISVEQHGVTVRRDSHSIHIRFQSGSEIELPPDAPWQIVDDPAPTAQGPEDKALPQPPQMAHQDEDLTRFEIGVDAPDAAADGAASDDSEPAL